MGLAKMGADGSRVSTFCFSIWLHIQLDVINLAMCISSTFIYKFSCGKPGGRISISPTSASPIVVRHPIEHPTHIQASMTLPTRPHAIFSTLQGTQNPDTRSTLAKS
jgi:hypothetical protein